MIWAVVIIYVFVIVCSLTIGWWLGYGTYRKEAHSDAIRHASEVTRAYTDGVRVGKRQMLDHLVHEKLLPEETAEAVSDGL